MACIRSVSRSWFPGSIVIILSLDSIVRERSADIPKSVPISKVDTPPVELIPQKSLLMHERKRQERHETEYIGGRKTM